MTPFWLNLLRAHNRNGGYGLTFPFIAGAYNLCSSNNEISLSHVQIIITSIACEAPDDSYIVFKECDRLLQPVFAVASSYYKPSDIYTKIENPGSHTCSLFVAPVTFSEENASINSFSNHLYELYKNELTNSLFSYSNNNFKEFNEKDHQKIFLAKALVDDEET